MADRSEAKIGGRRARQQTRRLKAAELFAKGVTRAEVARQLKVSWRAVHEWHKSWITDGADALRSVGKPGPKPKFNPEHHRQLEALLSQGPPAFGFENDLWTLPRIRRVIADEMGIACSISETWRLLRGMRWSPQKPERRARERKEDRIRDWKERQWPEICAAAKADDRTIVFVDESGFSQKPARKSTWAPIGQTPQLEFNFAWKKLSVIGGITLKELYFQIHEESVKSTQVCDFVDQLCQQIGGKIHIVWDGLRAHWSKAVQAHIAAKEGEVTVSQLPAYAPELNPIEYLWGYVKGNDLANFCAKDLASLSAATRKAILRTNTIKSHLRAFWVQSELNLDLM